MLYGGDKHCERAMKNLAKDSVLLEQKSLVLRSLDSKQMVRVLSSKHLVAVENQKLDIMTRWRLMNRDLSAKEIDEIFCLQRLDRLKSTEKVEQLWKSEKCPGSLGPKVAHICFNRLKEDTARARLPEQMPPEPGDVRVFVRPVEWTYFSFRGLTMAASSIKHNSVSLICEHRERRFPAKSSYLSQVTRRWFSLSVRNESSRCIGHVVYRIRFTKESFRVELDFPHNYGEALGIFELDFLVDAVRCGRGYGGQYFGLSSVKCGRLCDAVRDRSRDRGNDLRRGGREGFDWSQCFSKLEMKSMNEVQNEGCLFKPPRMQAPRSVDIVLISFRHDA